MFRFEKLERALGIEGLISEGGENAPGTDAVEAIAAARAERILRDGAEARDEIPILRNEIDRVRADRVRMEAELAAAMPMLIDVEIERAYRERRLVRDRESKAPDPIEAYARSLGTRGGTAELRDYLATLPRRGFAVN